MQRKEYQLSPAQLEEAKELSKPVMYIVVAGVPPISPAEKMMSFWQRIAREMFFVWDTARPVEGKDESWFSAEPQTPRRIAEIKLNEAQGMDHYHGFVNEDSDLLKIDGTYSLADLYRLIAILEDYKHHSPPCVECGAKTPEEAEIKCKCSGDKDSCHGSTLWP